MKGVDSLYPFNFDETANDVIGVAFREARDLGHRFVGTEHLILALSQLDKHVISELFKQYEISGEAIRIEMIKRIGRQDAFTGIEDYTYRAKKCLERANAYAVRTNASEIMAEHILVSIMHDSEAMGYQILMALRMDIKALLNQLSHTFDKKNKTNVIKGGSAEAERISALTLEEDYESKMEGVLSEVAIDLTACAKDAPFDNVVGRQTELDRILQILTRRDKNNVCLLGEPGVGKTAIVKALANRIAMQQVPDHFKNKKLLELNLGALVSGTMYRGQFEERMKGIIDALVQAKDTIIFIDEIHNLMGVGATGEKSLDAVGLLKPYLSQGQIQLIGATTYQEYEKYIRPDAALQRRLQLVFVEEPDLEETREILYAVKSRYESFHQVFITDEAVEAALMLSKRYLPERKWPDKAIDILDEACSRKRFENLSTLVLIEEMRYRLDQLKLEKETAIVKSDFTRAAVVLDEEKKLLKSIERNEDAKKLLACKQLIIQPLEIQKVISDWVKIPVGELSIKEKYQLTQLETLLSKNVFGQEAAIDVVSRAIRRARVGLSKGNGPMGVFLFVGPTGVGKTELCKNIAKAYFGSEKHLIRMDMSEYMERHSVSKFIGAPPGYEGSRDGGLLTNAISKMPYSVVVFDEIEKAHEDVLNILLQIMDEGHIKDSKGHAYHFKDALIVLTSNLGSDHRERKSMGFSSGDVDTLRYEKQVALKEACEKFFKPEFMNRIHEVVAFKSLDETALMSILERELKALKVKLEERGTGLLVEEGIKHWLCKHYRNDVYGARPLIRGVETEISDRIAEQLIVLNEAPKGLVFSMPIEGEIEVEVIKE